MSKNYFQKYQKQFKGELCFNVSLSHYSFFKIGGPAAVLAMPTSFEDLIWLKRGLADTGWKVFFLGHGSNVLVEDSGFTGLVIQTTKLDQRIEAVKPGKIRTGASVSNAAFLKEAMKQGWGGLELLAGIPGTLSGAVVMNAGSRQGETRERVKRVEAYSTDPNYQDALQVFEGKYLAFSYRRNLFLDPDALVVAIEWQVTSEKPEHIRKIIDESLAERYASQPTGYPSCGSVFKNPKALGLKAWEVIEKLGLRGKREGGAQYSDKHANFIINLGGATSKDVRTLIELAKNRAHQELGIELEEEIVYLG